MSYIQLGCKRGMHLFDTKSILEEDTKTVKGIFQKEIGQRIPKDPSCSLMVI